jgi:hypothetical protein
MKNQKLNFKNLNLILIFILPITFLAFGIKKQNELHEKLMIQGIGIDFDNENSDSIDSEPMDFGDNGPSFSDGNIGGEDTGEEESETGGEEALPSPEELGVDMTDSNNPDFD